MADEARITVSMNVDKRSADKRSMLLSFPGRASFSSDVFGGKGPLPGSILVPLTGVDVDLSQLTTPGLYWLHHQGPADGTDPGNTKEDYYVEYGIKTVDGVFLPWGELWPGDQFPGRFSRNLLESYNTTGTGTGPPTNFLHMMAYILPSNVWVGAFER